MDNTIKPLSRLLLLTILVCGLSFQISYVSGTSTPSVPEFTVELVAYPYDVPPVTTTKIDQYTGEETVKTTPGYHVENRSIEIVIKNQPFTPYTDEEDNDINLYYNVRVKGHFGEDWKELIENGGQSSSEYTVFSLSAEYPDGAQVDFQVESLVGYFRTEWRSLVPVGTTFIGKKSGWSNTQTITISEENVQIILNEEIPEFPSWIILPLVLTVTVVVAIYKKRLPKTTNNCQSY